jgi:hypothetical protein
MKQNLPALSAPARRLPAVRQGQAGTGRRQAGLSADRQASQTIFVSFEILETFLY